MDLKKWQLVIDAIAAFAMLLVAALAIWGDWVKHRLGPRLVLELEDTKGERSNVSTDQTPKWRRYYHLRVANRRRWAQASNVRITVTQVMKPSADGTLIDQLQSGPLQLQWQFPNLQPMYRTIGPDAICDLGFIPQDGNFELALYYSASEFDKFVKPNQRMIVVTKAVADNAESQPLCINIAWNGQWSDDTLEMENHLNIKDVDCSRVT